MKLERISSESEKKRVALLLKNYYEARPDAYGLMDRDQSEYEAYADVVARWTPRAGTVLDLGCGTYRTPALIQERGFRTTGCDLFSDEKLEAYKKAVGQDGPRLLSYEGHTLPFEAASFDTVATLCVFEHVSDVDGLLLEIGRVLKPAGRLIILGPNLGGMHTWVLALVFFLRGKGRFSHYPTFWSILPAGFRELSWTLRLMLNRKPEFIYKYPFIKDGNIRFEQSDDDAIQLNLPISFKNWFRAHGYTLRQYNRGAGDSPSRRLFNILFPSFATKVHIVAEKQG